MTAWFLICIVCTFVVTIGHCGKVQKVKALYMVY